MGLGFRVSGLGVCGFRGLGAYLGSLTFFLKDYVRGVLQGFGVQESLDPVAGCEKPEPRRGKALNPPPPPAK